MHLTGSLHYQTGAWRLNGMGIYEASRGVLPEQNALREVSQPLLHQMLSLFFNKPADILMELVYGCW